MLERIKAFLTKTVANIPASAGTKAIVYYAVILVAELLLFNAGWLFNWYASGKADIPMMIEFLTVLVGAQFTTAVMLIGKGLVDKDGDGIPDALETEGDGKNENRSHIAGFAPNGPRS